MSAATDLTVGDVVAETTYRLTRDSLVRYAGASGDFNPIHYRERGRSDDIGVAGRASRLRVEVEGAGGEDRARELAHLLTADEIRGGGWEHTALEFGVHWHEVQLKRGSPAASMAAGLPLRISRLLAAVALQEIHGINRNCVAADVVFVLHSRTSPKFVFHRVVRGVSLYNRNDTVVIPLDVVVRRVARFP